MTATALVSAQHDPGLLNVQSDLGSQLASAVESELVTESLDERNRGLSAVELPAEVEDERLELSWTSSESRTSPKAGCCEVSLPIDRHPRCIDSIAGQQLVGRWLHVDGRESEHPAPLVSPNDRSGDRIWTTEEGLRGREVAHPYGIADPAGADRFAAEGKRLDDSYSESKMRTKRLQCARRSLPLVAELEFRADNNPTDRTCPGNAGDEVGRRLVRETAIERQYCDCVDSRTQQQARTLGRISDGRLWRVLTEHLAGQRIECGGHRRRTGRLGTAYQSPDERLMTEVHAIESTDREMQGASRPVFEIPNYGHAPHSTRYVRWRASLERSDESPYSQSLA